MFILAVITESMESESELSFSDKKVRVVLKRTKCDPNPGMIFSGKAEIAKLQKRRISVKMGVS